MHLSSKVRTLILGARVLDLGAVVSRTFAGLAFILATVIDIEIAKIVTSFLMVLDKGSTNAPFCYNCNM